MSGVIVKSCPSNCRHSYQDAKYGGKRLMNVGGTPSSPKYVCTVCGKENKGK